MTANANTAQITRSSHRLHNQHSHRSPAFFVNSSIYSSISLRNINRLRFSFCFLLISSSILGSNICFNLAIEKPFLLVYIAVMETRLYNYGAFGLRCSPSLPDDHLSPTLRGSVQKMLRPDLLNVSSNGLSNSFHNPCLDVVIINGARNGPRRNFDGTGYRRLVQPFFSQRIINFFRCHPGRLQCGVRFIHFFYPLCFVFIFYILIDYINPKNKVVN